ncbi:F-box domain-containing protein [Hirschfeldia incana]|nr:F-box domain-containing protein [Hirschfeldia incana]
MLYQKSNVAIGDNPIENRKKHKKKEKKRELRRKKKHALELKKQPPEPPSLISSLPEEIFIDITGCVPLSYYPALSQVSRRFRSLISSPELYARRSYLERAERCIYVPVSKDKNSRIHWFTLCNIERLEDQIECLHH